MSRFLSCRRYCIVKDRAYSGQAMDEKGLRRSKWPSLTDLARRIPYSSFTYAVPRVHVPASGIPGRDHLLAPWAGRLGLVHVIPPLATNPPRMCGAVQGFHPALLDESYSTMYNSTYTHPSVYFVPCSMVPHPSFLSLSLSLSLSLRPTCRRKYLRQMQFTRRERADGVLGVQVPSLQ